VSDAGRILYRLDSLLHKKLEAEKGALVETQKEELTRKKVPLDEMGTAPDLNNTGIIAIYETHLEAEAAVRQLQQTSFDMKKLSIIGKDFRTEEQVVGYYNTGERAKYWGKLGAFWGGLWGLLFGSALFVIPGVGPTILAGSFISTLVGAIEGAVVVGGLSALGAALFSLGIPQNSVLEYETALKAGKYLLIAHGTPEELKEARDILKNSGARNITDFDLANFMKTQTTH